MGGEIKKYLKITTYTMLTLSLLIFISFILVVSHPFFLNIYVSSVVKYSGADPEVFEFHIYSKELFAAEHFNASLAPEDDFIFFFDNRYGTRSKSDFILIVIYEVDDPDDRLIHTNYWVNKYTGLVFTSTWREDRADDNKGELIIENETINVIKLENSTGGSEN